jgi:hypothetical protein
MASLKQNPKPYQSDLDFKQLDEDAEISDVISNYNEVVKGINFTNKRLSFQANFDGYIASVTIPAGSEVQIQHFLDIIPKWRIILRQEGNGVISDIPSGWNDKFITLKNNGAVSVTISVLIARE